MIEQYWPFWIGGLEIAGLATLITVLTGNFLGVTRGYVSLCSVLDTRDSLRSRLEKAFGINGLFAVGLVLGGLIAAISSGQFKPSFAYGNFDQLFGSSLLVKAPILIFGGVLWGYGSRLAGGCTSGNSISGLAKGSKSSLIVTISFLVAGAITTRLILSIFGGAV